MVISNKLYNIRWLHCNFFYYRHFFLYNKYTLVGAPLSNIQLTYMNNMWENTNIPLYKSIVKVATYQQNTIKQLYRLKNLPSLILLLKKYSCYLLTSKVNLRRISQNTSQYYLFLNNKNSIQQKNYIQGFISWLQNFKKNIIFKQINIKKNTFRYKRRRLINNLYVKPTTHKTLIKNIRYYSKSLNSALIINVSSLNYKQPLIYKYLYKSLSFKTSWFMNIKRKKSFKKNNMWRILPPKLKRFKKTIFSKPNKLPLKYIQPIYNNLKPLVIKPSKLLTFILRNSGMFLISKFKWLKTQNLFKSQYKKKLFSFIFPGQLKKNLLIRRKKIILTRLLTHFTKNITIDNKLIYKNFYKLFKLSFFLNKKNLLVNSLNTNYQNNLNHIRYNFDFATKGYDVGDIYISNEVRISRIRFKPGYQRIWRQVRSAVKVALNIKFQYQHQLTKYLIKFYHLSNQYLLSYSESTLDKILVYSHLLPDISTIILFHNKGFIFLNGNIALSLKSILIKNDFIQLIVSLWYYIITRWFLNWTQLRLRKFKRMVYRKNKPFQYKIMKTKKQQSLHTPNWVYQTRYDNNDIKPYLESDFFTLSVFILTDNYVNYYHKVDDLVDLRNSIYMLYNWKYIT